ncbi:hypothetical protein [Streptomyces sp. NPDC003273]|uniref:hypothetical protein n=1 Tax=Streptomyces sp. NPDC003273 TaxID=3364678 RepID=UPI00369E3DD6
MHSVHIPAVQPVLDQPVRPGWPDLPAPALLRLTPFLRRDPAVELREGCLRLLCDDAASEAQRIEARE